MTTVDPPRPDESLALQTIAASLGVEYAGMFPAETIRRCLETSYDLLARHVTDRQRLPLLAERFTRKRLLALARVEGKGGYRLPVVLFVCGRDAVCSQMALGWFNHLAAGRAVGLSAGSAPAGRIDPLAIAAMREVGIDISQGFPKPCADEIVRAADVVVVTDCDDACPDGAGERCERWSVDCLAVRSLHLARRLRDDLGRCVRSLLGTFDIPVLA